MATEARSQTERLEPIDSFRLERIARNALQNPSRVTQTEVLKMAASIVAHIENYPEDKNYLQYATAPRVRAVDASAPPRHRHRREGM